LLTAKHADTFTIQLLNKSKENGTLPASVRLLHCVFFAAFNCIGGSALQRVQLESSVALSISFKTPGNFKKINEAQNQFSKCNGEAVV
jgi:hypothetical protein